MAWPDIPKRLWSYAIGKLRLFTDFDESSLSANYTSLSLENVQIDVSKLNAAVFTATKCHADQLAIELTSSGLLVSLHGLSLDGCLQALEPPDMVLSMFLSTAFQDFEQFTEKELKEEPSADKKAPSVLEKISKAAIGQIVVHITNAVSTLKLKDSDSGINVHIDSLIWSGNKKLELELITLTTFEALECNVSSSDDDLLNSHMSRSIYFDIGSSSGIAVDNCDLELGTIDRIVLNYEPMPFSGDLTIENVNIDGFVAFEFAVKVINTLFSNTQQQKPSSSQPSAASSEIGCLDVFVNTVTVFDFEGYGSSSNLCLSDIQFKENVITINSFHCEGIVSLNPFLKVDCSGPVIEIEINTPFNMNIPIAKLEPFKQMLFRLNAISTELRFPESDEITRFNVQLPEIQVELGDLVKMQLFIDSLTETGIQVNELVLISGEGQILLGRTSVSFDELVLDLESLKFNIRPSLITNFEALKTLFSPQEFDKKTSSTPSSSASSSTNQLSPWNASIRVKTLFVQYNDLLTLNGNLFLISSLKSIDLKSEMSFSSNLVKGKTSLHCCSFPDFTSLVGNIKLSELEIFINPGNQSNEQHDQHEQLDQLVSKQNQPELPELPELLEPVSINVIGNFLVNLDFFLEDIKVHFPNETTVLIDPKNVSVTIGAGKIKVSFRQATLSLLDSSDDSKVKILTIDALRSTITDTKIETRVKSVCLGCCADSVYQLQQAVSSIPTSATQQVFKVEPDGLIDVFKDIQEVFVPSKLEEFQSSLANQVSSLQIKDEYIWSAPVTKSRVIESGDLEKQLQIKLSVRKFEWQLFDGYDLHETRIGMSKAIKALAEKSKGRSKKSAKESEENVTTEEAYMNMTLYDSILITPHTTEIDTIKRQIKNEMQGTGVEGFSRSDKPKIRVRLQYINIDQTSFAYGDGNASIEIRSGEILDEVPTSVYPRLVFRAHGDEADTILFKYNQDTIVVGNTADLKVKIQIEPLRISVDQDTAEFINRFFQFENKEGELLIRDDSGIDQEQEQEQEREQEPEIGPEIEPETTDSTNKPFIQRVTLSPLLLNIDYNPKKIDYRILRSGGTAQLLNVFPIKGAKLRLKPVNLYGISGWDGVVDEVLKEWMPDIRDNQLTDLVTGLSPIRKIINASKGIRRSQASRFTGVIFKRTMDELDRIKSHFKS